MAVALPQIFINYRRTDSQAFANHLRFYLEAQFGKGTVFLDTSSIPAGEKWPNRIRLALDAAKVVMVVLGKTWLASFDEGFRRRIDLPDDWVRNEIEHALATEKILIPILVEEEAKLPQRDHLPPAIAALADCEQFVLRYAAIDRDFAGLADTLRCYGVQGVPQPNSRLGDPGLYLENLRTESGQIDIKGIQTRNTKAQSFPIEELYITLTYTGRQSEQAGVRGQHRPRKAMEPSKAAMTQIPPEPVNLEQALTHSRLLVMGDPGSGKTTFLRKIACEAARLYQESVQRQGTPGAECQLPILIKISDFCGFLQRESNSAGRPDDNSPAWLQKYLTSVVEHSNWHLTKEDVEHWLQATASPGTLMLLDGLDEAPDETLRERVQKIVAGFARNAAKQYPAVRIVVTSRPLELTGAIDLPAFEVARINPLDDTAIQTFLGKWCATLHTDDPTRVPAHLQELRTALNARPEIRRMAKTPVMLTALAVVHWNEGRMPEQRSQLYGSVLYWLDQARRRQRQARTPSLPSALPVLQDLALGMQTHQNGFRKQLPRRDAAKLVMRRFPAAEADLSLDAAEEFLRLEQLDGGIVVERQGQLEFWHRSFQEFLAARAIAARQEADQREVLMATPERIYQPEWREVMRLLGGVLREQGDPKLDGLFAAIVDQLPPKPRLSAAARCVGLIGEMLRDLVNPSYPAPGGRYATLRDEVEGIFDPARASQVAVKVRIEAADALGQVRRARAPRTSDEYWIAIPGGAYSIGSSPDKNHALYDPERYDFELTPRQVTLPPFQIARDPVTVGEFEEFLDDGGYAQRKYWGAGGYGEYGIAPENWVDQLRYPARPVVNVSWHVTMAFCAWAEHALPTEEQWEAAARGQASRRYPWGGHRPDSEKLNDEEIGHPTPPGIFPSGSTPDGICDLAGNVWEWCRNDLDGSPEVLDVPADESRVIRGGSWVNDARNVRCASRLQSDVDDQGFGLGFRLVRVQKS